MLKRKLLFGSLIILILSTSSDILAQENADSKFNALYITNFAKYVIWPSDIMSEKIIITVLGNDPVINELNNIASIILNGNKKIIVRQTEKYNNIDTTHILFIPEHKSKLAREIIDFFKGKPVLIVTNKTGLAEMGAGINIHSVYWKLRYEINTSSLKTNKLKADSVLFRLGKEVK